MQFKHDEVSHLFPQSQLTLIVRALVRSKQNNCLDLKKKENKRKKKKGHQKRQRERERKRRQSFLS